MNKIVSLFARNYDGDRLVRDEVVPGAEWVLAGEGRPTVKYDGTACMVRDGVLYKRYDRKGGKSAPDGWVAAEDAPNEHTGHWPGWVPVGDGPDDQWHRQAFADPPDGWQDGTYELLGPKVQGNPYTMGSHVLAPHGLDTLQDDPRTFDAIRDYLTAVPIEGIVWHHPDGRMVKIKARDFGLRWPR
jgi:hypothetical protein